MIFKKIYSILFAVLILILNCNISYSDNVSTVVATVDGTPILSSDIDNQLKLFSVFYNQKPSSDLINQLVMQAAKVTVMQRVILAEGERLKINISESEIKKNFEEIAASIDLTPDELTSKIASSGVDGRIIINQIRSQIVWNLILSKFISPRISISESDVDEYIQYGFFEPGVSLEYSLRQVIVKKDKNNPSAYSKKLTDLNNFSLKYSDSFHSCAELDSMTSKFKLPKATDKKTIHVADINRYILADLMEEQLTVGKISKVIDNEDFAQVFLLCDETSKIVNNEEGRFRIKNYLYQIKIKSLSDSYLKNLYKNLVYKKNLN